MKWEEERAREFLVEYFGKTPTYEPLGKSTAPDFSINQVAFEVRRLNQQFLNKDGSFEGLEQVDLSLNLALRKQLSQIPFSDDAGTILWSTKFSRPLTDKVGRIVRTLVKVARSHYLGASRTPMTTKVGGVTFKLFAGDLRPGKAIIPGYEVDDDSGGMIGDIYPTSIRLALEEKLLKTKSVADRFERWVLVLVDDILPGASALSDDIGPLALTLDHFDSVVVINQANPALVLEYPEGSLRESKSLI